MLVGIDSSNADVHSSGSCSDNDYN